MPKALASSAAKRAANDPRSADEIWKDVEKHEQEIAAAEKRMLKTANKTREVGAATCEKIHQQNEQIKQIKTQQKDIGTNIKTSNKIMHSIESLSGAFLTMVGIHQGHDERPHFAGKKAVKEDSSDEEAAELSPSEPPSSEASPVATGSKAGSRAGSKAATKKGSDQTEGAAQEEDAMSQISSIVAELKVQADEMNAELKKQNKELDGMSATAEEHKANIKRNNQRANKILGKKKRGGDDDDDGLPGTKGLGIASIFPNF